MKWPCFYTGDSNMEAKAEVTTQPPSEVLPSDKISPDEVHFSPPARPCYKTFCSTNPADGPDIVIGESGIAAEKPITIPDLLKMTVSRVPDRVALCYKNDENWTDVTYKQYYDLVLAAAKSFLKVVCYYLLAVAEPPKFL